MNGTRASSATPAASAAARCRRALGIPRNGLLILDLLGDPFTKHTLRTPDQERDEDQHCEHVLKVGCNESGRECFEQADNNAAHDGARNAPESPDDDADPGLDEQWPTHIG